MIVVDTSVLLPALAELGHAGDHARSRLGDEHLCAPELIDLELASGLKGLERCGQLAPEMASRNLGELGPFPLERFPHRPFLRRIWELRHNLSIYDASYVALAETLRVPLVTADRSIAEAPGVSCEIDLLVDP